MRLFSKFPLWHKDAAFSYIDRDPPTPLLAAEAFVVFLRFCAHWRDRTHSDPDGIDHGLEAKPMLAFALCYVAAHLALDLLDEQEAETILNYCEKYVDEN